MIRKGRLARLSRLGGMAAAIAGEAAGAGVRMATHARDEAADRLHRRTAEQLARALGEMKGLPLKLGQLLSYLDDAIPAEHRHHYNEVLGRLQAGAEPLPWDEIAPVIAQDLGAPVDALFERFDPEPVAAASIGQVYRATLPGGQPVAVKVQYPGVAEAIDADLDNVAALVHSLEAVVRADFHHVLQDVTARLREEVDYVLEATHQAEFAARWAGDPEVVIPAMFPTHCGRRVLTSEWIDGAPWAEMLDRASPGDQQRYGLVLWRFVYQSLYHQGLLNADPHPGNYLFLPDGRVAFLDFGCVQRFTRAQVEGFRAIRLAATSGAADAELRALCVAHFGLPPDLDDALWELFRDYLLLSFEPLLAEQPWRFTRAYTEKIARFALDAKQVLARTALRGGLVDPAAPGTVFLTRLNYGVATLLARLEVEADWPRMLVEAGIDPPAEGAP